MAGAKPYFTNANGVKFFDPRDLCQELDAHRFSAERAREYDLKVTSGEWVWLEPPQDFSQLEKFAPNPARARAMGGLDAYRRALRR